MTGARLIGIRQDGFSLIELMIAMTLGLLLTFGVITFFQDSLQTSRATISQGRLQEVALMALNTIKTDVRMAGFRGECVPPQSLPEDGSAIPNFFAVAGEERNNASSDLFSVYTADIQEDNLFLWHHNVNENELTVCANEQAPGATCTPAEFEADDLLLVSDCERWVVFQPNRGSSTSAPNTIISPTPNNDGETPDLSPFVLPRTDTAANDPSVRQGGDRVGVIYRVGSGNDSGLTNYQVVRDTNPSNQANGNIQLNQLLRNGEPILFGVEGMQVLYGQQLDGRIEYREGCIDSETNSPLTCATALLNTTHVRLSLIMQSDQRIGDAQQPALQVADLDNGTFQPANDGRIRQVYSTTIKIRNRSGELNVSEQTGSGGGGSQDSATGSGTEGQTL